jgi:RimJ/RimL family protein N-acetyltransferase
MVVGDNVFLRPLQEGDLPEIYKWNNDFELKELFDSIIHFRSSECLKKDFEAHLGDTSTMEFTIVEKDTKKTVGRCTLYDVDFINRKCLCKLYIGDRESRDKGYGTESMLLLMKLVFHNLNLNRLGLWVFDFNKRAIKSYKKCGMKVEGIMREGIYRNGRYHDIYLMGILKQEYTGMIGEGEKNA